MPSYKDEERNSWYCKFYYTDWQGNKKAKLKRGFAKQKDAKEYERMFLDRQQANPQMTFGSLIDLYTEDMTNRLRRSTMENKKHLIETKLRPYFGEMKLETIKPTTIRKWQNELISQGFAETYLKSINNQLSALMNYAVKYYGLRENPCIKAGSMGKKHADEMNFWTREEFQQFIVSVEDKSVAHACFQILYWCGIREGELLALTLSDIDFDAKTLSVNKSYQRIGQEDIITEPKTPKSKRIVAIPDFLAEELKTYLERLYKPTGATRLFQVTKYFLCHEMDRGCKLSGVKRIRVHDLRHSHASLLIELGFSPLLIAERLGHENIETTLNTYSHLYPHKQAELAQKLDDFRASVSY
ncbi:MAG: site-specific integrase [Oscillospiraceae bacterium]